MTLIDKAEALLPCPFCGGEAELWNAHDNRPAWIACMGRCAVLISKEHATDAEAIAAWNRRAALPARGVGVPEAMRQMIVQAVAFANRAAGEGICIDDLEPETFLFNYRQATGDEDLDTLPDRILAALAPTDAAQAEDSYPYDGPEQCERDLEDTAAQAREAALRQAAKALLSVDEFGGRREVYDACAGRVKVYKFDAVLRALIGEDRT